MNGVGAISRNPNTGPYVVVLRDPSTGSVYEKEAQTWVYACQLMRAALIGGYVIEGCRFV